MRVRRRWEVVAVVVVVRVVETPLTTPPLVVGT
jgi:hypothetical protein